MKTEELLRLLLDLQRRFDTAATDDEALKALETYLEAMKELRSRGHDEERIEQLLRHLR